ncbi:MAG TPA: substrate-binding domain-containing protein [Thermoplasmata archaeon]|nr:substrate-binding domain-containing protein [Thermoplasmata archaeon]
MRPMVRNGVVVAAVVVCAFAGFAGGWLLHPASSSPSAPATLAVIAAGSLAPSGLLPTLLSDFAAATPGVSAPTAAQLYEGSSAAATALAEGGQPYDLFVSADFRVIPQSLEGIASPAASWEVVFGADPLVLAYNSSTSALSGISGTNWYSKIVQPGVVLGAPNASADPLGANAIIALELEDSDRSLGGSLYGHFFSGGEGALAQPTSSVRLVAETTAATALSTGEVNVYLIYRSYAAADHLAYVTLDPSVNLGGTNATDVADYASASTTVLSSSGGTKSVAGAPVLFALTVPSTAPDALLGLDCAAYLLSNATAALWASDGFIPLAPLWTDAPGHLPPSLSGSAPQGVAPLPSYLTALLA